MGVEGCTKCIKYMLFFFNFIFWLAGGVVLGVALWLRHDGHTSSLLELKFDGQQAPTTFLNSVHILIAVGAVMMVVGFLGCYGAIQESQCLLGTFFACLVILFACEVAAGIFGFMHKDSISKELITFYDNVYENSVATTLTDQDKDKKQAAAAVLKVFHKTLECCGRGFSNPFTTLITQGFTDICPKSVSASTTDCHGKITELFTEKVYLIGITALIIAIIMIFEMTFSMVLCCGIRNSPVY
ncbi:CD81 antigen [Oncorhynchus tshawytscha]|uniref:Tetraspanin n=2 Tax=Oncorhynchus TaxID=8016 RepID=A0A8C7DTB3_ONCKI|nr:CD81 antigen [Oncorhynchus kisutch]XP_024260991.1 CD81 antigen [Oncorhynchus tshawytscha]XP_035595084.1 CD81 antigen-like [Oncorhynchus keta]